MQSGKRRELMLSGRQRRAPRLKDLKNVNTSANGVAAVRKVFLVLQTACLCVCLSVCLPDEVTSQAGTEIGKKNRCGARLRLLGDRPRGTGARAARTAKQQPGAWAVPLIGKRAVAMVPRPLAICSRLISWLQESCSRLAPISLHFNKRVALSKTSPHTHTHTHTHTHLFAVDD